MNGGREQAEVALAKLQLLNADQLRQRATAARTVRAACELYLRDARTGKQTIRTDRTACNRICEQAHTPSAMAVPLDLAAS